MVKGSWYSVLENPHTFIFKCPFCGNPRYGYYFRDFHKVLEIYERAARVQFLKKLLNLVAQKLLQNKQQQQQKIVALFLHQILGKNSQIVKQKKDL